MDYAALCCIAKDEDPFLREWVAYHLAIGFEHVIIYDDRSAVPIATLLHDFIALRRVTVLRSDKQQNQYVVYNHCLREFGPQYKWIAFLDADEYVCLSQTDDIRLLLEEYEPYGSLGLSWRMFGSNGHETRPEGLVLEQYTQWFEDNTHIKSIVQPAKVTVCASPHAFHLKPGEHGVNPDHFPIPSGFPFSCSCMGKASIHHFYFKSRQCFTEKIARGNPCNIERRMNEFDTQLAYKSRPDKTLLPLADKVRAIMQNPKSCLLQEPFVAETEAEELLLLVRVLLEHNNHKAARLCVCRAMLYANTEQAHMAWILRAQLARQTQQLSYADYCLKQAFFIAATSQAYTELAQLELARGNKEKCQQALSIPKAYNAQLP